MKAETIFEALDLKVLVMLKGLVFLRITGQCYKGYILLP